MYNRKNVYGGLVLLGALLLVGAGCKIAPEATAPAPLDATAPTSATASDSVVQPVDNKPVPKKVTVAQGKNENRWLIKHGDTVVYELDTASGGEVSVEVFKESPRFTYVGVQPGGMGGYILFGLGWMTVFQVDTVSGKITEINPNDVMIEEISADDKLVAGTIRVDNVTGVYVRNLDTDAEKIYPVDARYGQYGSLHFSPNGKNLAYAAAKGEPEGEAGAVLQIDLASGKTTVVATTAKPNSYFTVRGWKNDTTIDYGSANTGL